VLARDLYKMLGTPRNGGALREAIAPALPAYRHGLAERGRSCPVVIQCDGSFLTIAASHVAALCEAFLDEQLDAVELGYVATALELAPDFHFISDEVQECTFFLSSPEVNGSAANESVSTILRVLREHAA
jgi:hypothetical protein